MFDLLPILNHFRSRGWNTSWDCIATRFLCVGTPDDPGCGSKIVSTELHPRTKLDALEPVPTDTQVRQKAKRERR